jgi:hypothetical protein
MIRCFYHKAETVNFKFFRPLPEGSVMQDGAHFTATRLVRAEQNDQVFCKCPPRSPDLTVCDIFPLGVREGQSVCTSTTRNRRWAAGRHNCSCQLGHAGYAAESLVQSELDYRIDVCPSNKRGAHSLCVIPHEIVWVYATVATNFVRIFQ